MSFLEQGQRIRARRKQLDMTQTDVSVLTGISQKQISRYESGENDLTGANAVALAAALHTTTDWLVGRVEYDYQLGDHENELLILFRSKTPEQREYILDMIRSI